MLGVLSITCVGFIFTNSTTFPENLLTAMNCDMRALGPKDEHDR